MQTGVPVFVLCRNQDAARGDWSVPEGIRANFYLDGGTIEGPRLQGKVLAVGADYLLLRSDGVGVLDVRATFEAADGALI